MTDAATEAAEAASSTESRRRLRIFINNDPFFAPERIMTGTEILRLAGLPEGNQLFLEVPGPGDDRPIAAEMTPTPEERLENLIAQVGTGIFSAEVQAEVERILSPGQSLEPMARARFIDAARRGLRPVALEYGPLELLLFHTRRDRGRDAEDIAQRVGIGVESLRAIERGERPLVDEDPANIARWVLSLDVSRDVLAPALRTSIGTPAGTGAYGVRREARVSEDQERFVQEVLRAFDEASTKRS